MKPVSTATNRAAAAAVLNHSDHDEDAAGSAAAGAAAWNPAFDVTPAELITGFITEHGVLRPPFSESLSPVLAR